MKKIIAVLSVLFCIYSANYLVTNAEDITAYAYDSKCISMLNFLSNNIEELKNEYNKTHEESLTISSFEGYSIIYNMDDSKYGIYIDFDGENGYLVTSLEFDLYELQVSGDLDYLKNVDFAYYNSVDGFLYLENGKYEKYDVAQSTFNLNSSGINMLSNTRDGGIEFISEYIRDNHPDYVWESSQTSAMYDGYLSTKQTRTTYYIQYHSGDNGQTYGYYTGEGNCGLNAIYNVMVCWGEANILPLIPGKDITLDVYANITRDPNFPQYGTGNPGTNVTSYWTLNHLEYLYNMPFFYDNIRRYAVANCGYTPESGVNITDVPSIMSGAGEDFNYHSLSPQTTTSFATAKEYLDNGRAVFLGMNDSTTYGDHAVALLGYELYSYTSGWWIFETTDYFYYYLIDDGWSDLPVYFDVDVSPATYRYVVY